MRQIKRQILFGISLLLFGLAFAHSCYGDTSRSLVENSWRYENGEIVSSLNASEDEGISTLSITDLPTGATAEGIDVSEHQKKVDWEAVKASGIDFAILRIGFGAPSFGGRLDYQFQRNISECERLGIPYGIYLYSYAWDDSQAEDEASFVIDNLAGHTPQLPVYYDLEDNSIIAEGRQAGIASRASIFCNRITSAGYSVGIYANLYWFNNVLTDQVFKSSAWDHWIAQYNYQCDYTGNYSIWQYASDGLVPGVNGYVDMNYSYGSVVAESVKAQRADELASQHAGDLADGTYVIRSAKRPSSALEAKGGRTANGTAVSLYDVNGTVAQAWTVTHEGDYVVIRNAKSGRAIDPTGPSSDPGTKLQLWDASGTRPQRWIAIRRDDGGYEFRSAMDPDAAFDLTSGKTSNGTRAQLYTANGTEAQSWALEAYELPETRADELASQHAGDLADGTYVIRSAKLPSSALEAKGGRTANGTAVSLYDVNGTVAQAWTVTHEGDYVVIRNAKSGRAIDPTGPSSDPGTKLQLWDASGTRPQRWIAIRRDDGSYEFRSAMDPEAAFDLTSGRTSNGTRAQLYTANGTEAQSWALEAYELPETRADELASQHAGDLADGTYVIRSAKRPTAALEAKGGRTANGTAVSLYDANGTVAQAWTVTHEGDYVVIRNAKSGRAIDPTGPSSDPGTKLQLWDASGTRPQRWIAIRRDDGSYEFRSAMDPEAAFDLTSGRTSNGTRTQLYTANGTEAQSWLLSVSK